MVTILTPPQFQELVIQAVLPQKPSCMYARTWEVFHTDVGISSSLIFSEFFAFFQNSYRYRTITAINFVAPIRLMNSEKLQVLWEVLTSWSLSDHTSPVSLDHWVNKRDIDRLVVHIHQARLWTPACWCQSKAQHRRVYCSTAWISLLHYGFHCSQFIFALFKMISL